MRLNAQSALDQSDQDQMLFTKLALAKDHSGFSTVLILIALYAAKSGGYFLP